MSKFTELNGLTISGSGVYQLDHTQAFNYSDGAESEQHLHNILSSATDLSSQSVELESQIVDWPTEYHLSSSRANLLRGLNLNGVSRVLELGCGCGSITRYLGEQPDLEVDSVEGSAIRASLAALRCRDLDNVTISTGNFNSMSFPQGYYDLVLFVGVTEYAGRFSDAATDQQALQGLLGLAKQALAPSGAMVIAIENRTGLKYMMGANEDHYGVPYVGIDDYPDSTGIRTYTQQEWQAQISEAGFAATRFIYPFPDYKVPTLLVHENCNPKAPALLEALSNTRSRDYLAAFDLGDREAKLWQSVLEANALGDFANSFMLVVGDDEDRIQALSSFELVEYQHAELPDYAPRFSERNSAEQIRNQKLHAENLEYELVQLREHAKQLEQKLALITHSKGWRVLNKIRSMFGKSNIVD